MNDDDRAAKLVKLAAWQEDREARFNPIAADPRVRLRLTDAIEARLRDKFAFEGGVRGVAAEMAEFILSGDAMRSV